MKDITIFPAVSTESCRFAATFLKKAHLAVTDHIFPDITHLLLDIPSFDDNGNLKDGSDIQELLYRLPEDITVIGGNLEHHYLSHYKKIDMLKDSLYLANNAAITAECALQIAANHLGTTLTDSHILILGWGRIGKCLSRLLKSIGCTVTVAARKECDRALLCALGYKALDYTEVPNFLPHCDIIFNTVPHQTVDPAVLNLSANCIKVDLASSPGIKCNNIIIARGLPGKYAPKTSGKLIANSIQRILKEVSQ